MSQGIVVHTDITVAGNLAVSDEELDVPIMEPDSHPVAVKVINSILVEGVILCQKLAIEVVVFHGALCFGERRADGNPFSDFAAEFLRVARNAHGTQAADEHNEQNQGTKFHDACHHSIVQYFATL